MTDTTLEVRSPATAAVSSSYPAVLLVLRGGVGLMCLGTAAEVAAAGGAWWLVGALVAAALSSTVRPHWIVLSMVACWFLVDSTRDAILLAEQDLLLSGLTWLSGSARYLGPVALILLLVRGRAGRRDHLAEWLLRYAAAATFVGHGLRAVLGTPSFLELIELSLGVSRGSALQALLVIGMVDVAVAGVILVRRSRPAAGYMTFWAALAAGSRVTAYGFAVGWSMVATRALNFGVPLALVVWWASDHAGAGRKRPGVVPDSPSGAGESARLGV